MVALLVAGIALAPPTQAQEETPEARFLALLNQARVLNGRLPVAPSAELTSAALAHSQDMIRRGYMEHVNPEGESPQDRARRAGYGAPPGTGWLVIEAISARSTPETAIDWLLSDGLHRRVLLNGRYREVGIGFARGGAYGQIWAIKVGCRPNVLPVFARPAATGASVDLTLTNEECSPFGAGSFMGEVVAMQVSESKDFSGAGWEPFTSNRTFPVLVPMVNVRLRDAQGREITAQAQVAGVNQAAVAASPSPTESPTPTPSSTSAPPAIPAASATPTLGPEPGLTSTSTATPGPAASPSPTRWPTRGPVTHTPLPTSP